MTAHHAIIPTRVRARLGMLTETEENIYRLIAQAFIAQFYPEHVYEQTRAALDYHGEAFAVNGRREIQAGWRAIYRTAKKDTGEEADADGADG